LLNCFIFIFEDDMTTTEPSNITMTTIPETTVITSSVKPIPIVPMYGLKDINGQYYCIVLQGDILVDIQYTQSDDKVRT